MTSPWWAGLAPVEAAGPLGAEAHRMLWRAGELVLADHPDPQAEEALAALGAERCPCLDVLSAWQAQHQRPAILGVGARRFSEQLEAPLRTAAELQAEVRRWRTHLAELRVEARARRDAAVLQRLGALADGPERVAARRLGFLLLLALPAEMQRRLQASAAAALAARGWSARLAVATAARARPLAAGIGFRGSLADVDLVDTLAGTAVGPSELRLPLFWLADVWGRGMGIVDDAVVLGVTSVIADGAYEVVAAGIGKSQVAVRVVQWEDGWRTT